MTIYLFLYLRQLQVHECHRLAPNRLHLLPSHLYHRRRRYFPLHVPDAHDTLPRSYRRIVSFLRMANAVATPVKLAPTLHRSASIAASVKLSRFHVPCSESML